MRVMKYISIILMIITLILYIYSNFIFCLIPYNPFTEFYQEDLISVYFEGLWLIAFRDQKWTYNTCHPEEHSDEGSAKTGTRYQMKFAYNLVCRGVALLARNFFDPSLLLEKCFIRKVGRAKLSPTSSLRSSITASWYH